MNNGICESNTISFAPFNAKGQEFWGVEIRCVLIAGVYVFSNAIDAHKFLTNVWDDLSKRGLTLYLYFLYPCFSVGGCNIVFSYIQAAYCQQGYLASKIENHQVYITNGRQ